MVKSHTLFEVSDRCSRGEVIDKSGPAIVEGKTRETRRVIKKFFLENYALL